TIFIFVKKTGLPLNQILIRTEFIWASSLGLLSLLVWIGRNIILSGYPFYPSPLFAISSPWTMPKEKVVDTFSWIGSWARSPNVPWKLVLANGDWFFPWLKRNFHKYEFLWVILSTIFAG